MQGLSGRAYAKRKGVAAATAQSWRAKGWLALFPDGSIDAAASDRRLREFRQEAAPETSSLAAARRRKLQVQVAVLEDEVAALRASLLDPGQARRARLEAGAYQVRVLLALAPVAAPLVAGLPAAVAKERLTTEIHAVMNRLAGTIFVADGGEDQAPAATAPEGDLAARKTALSAERLEIKRAVARGELLRVADHVRNLQDKLGTARARLLSLPSKLARRLEHLGPEAAEAAIRGALLHDVVAELTGPLPGVGDLTMAQLLAGSEAGGA